MISSYRAKFDYIVIRPIYGIMVILAAASLFHKAWLMTLFFVFMIFVVGYVGGALHLPILSSKLVDGIPSFSDAEKIELDKPTSDDLFSIFKACFQLSFIIGIIASVITIYDGHGWLLAGLIGIGVYMLNAFVMAITFAFVVHQYAVGRLRSLASGLAIFWLPISAIVALAIFVI